MNYCSQCKKLKISEMQTVCKHCGHTDGSDRWFSHDDEHTPIKSITDC
ncbi:MAG: zinc ribbon domain-containing protein [Candidatus Woesearchaeota archaeon]